MICIESPYNDKKCEVALETLEKLASNPYFDQNYVQIIDSILQLLSEVKLYFFLNLKVFNYLNSFKAYFEEIQNIFLHICPKRALRIISALIGLIKMVYSLKKNFIT